MRRILAGALVVAMLFAVACGNDDADEGGGDSPPANGMNDGNGGDGAGDERMRLNVESADGEHSVEVRIEIAATESERQTGLSGRDELDEDAGMLFLFNGEPVTVPFWMKDTRIPLDIAYLGSDGTIQEIRHGEPFSEEQLRPEQPYWYVLEMNGGWFEDNGFGEGDRVRVDEVVSGE